MKSCRDNTIHLLDGNSMTVVCEPINNWRLDVPGGRHACSSFDLAPASMPAHRPSACIILLVTRRSPPSKIRFTSFIIAGRARRRRPAYRRQLQIGAAADDTRYVEARRRSIDAVTEAARKSLQHFRQERSWPRPALRSGMQTPASSQHHYQRALIMPQPNLSARRHRPECPRT